MKKYIISFFAVCSLLFLSACGDGNTDSPEKIATQYIQAIYEGDIDTAAGLVNLGDENDQTSKDMQTHLKGKLGELSANYKKQVDELGGIKAVTADKADYYEDKQKADVKVNVSFKNSEKVDTSTVVLVKTKKGWKINL